MSSNNQQFKKKGRAGWTGRKTAKIQRKSEKAIKVDTERLVKEETRKVD